MLSAPRASDALSFPSRPTARHQPVPQAVTRKGLHEPPAAEAVVQESVCV
ncbi:hypothetical protein ACIBW9_34585 [Streptomyces sp. NPDC049541]